MALLEIACFSADHAILAFNSGADRIELCKDHKAGGTTPSLESLLAVKRMVSIPVYAMIRPRGGDFDYDEEEFAQMEADIDRLKPMVDGYVFGMVNEDRTVDVARTAALVQRAAPLPCTFHRAFDETYYQRQALEDVIATGCNAVLSSGGNSDAVSGTKVLRDLVKVATGRIVVMPGGGVRASNILELYRATKALAYHSSGLNPEQGVADPDEIRHMKRTLLQQRSLAELPAFDGA